MQGFATGETRALTYAEAGAGQTLLLVHGWAAHGGFFAAQAPLGEKYHVIAPDLPGHGRSAARPARTLADLSDALADLVRTKDLTDVLAVGWSMGAAVLWDLLTRHGSNRFAGLIAVDMSPRIMNDQGWRLGLKGGFGWDDHARALTAMGADWPAYAKTLAPRIFASLGETSAWADAAFAENDPRVMSDLWDSLARFDARAAVAQCRVPMIVASGAMSQLYGAETARALAAGAPHAALATFQRSGHAPHMEEPQAFNDLIEAFAAALAEKTTDKLFASFAESARTL